MSDKNEMKDRKSSSDVDKSEITTKAFSILHERLLSSGKVTSKNLSLSGLKTNICPKSANGTTFIQILLAQFLMFVSMFCNSESGHRCPKEFLFIQQQRYGRGSFKETETRDS